jgi:uncharacterized membrane protein YgcG
MSERRNMQSRTIMRCALLAAVLSVAACQEIEPYARNDMWQPTGANAGNIAAMVANPYDLLHGRGSDRTDSNEPVLAIHRVNTDHTKALLDPGGNSAASTGSSGGGGGPGGGSGGGGGGSGGSGSSGG